MKVPFTKYHGTGNDFIMIDNRSDNFNLKTEDIARLCHRRFGVGADGLIYLLSSRAHDFEMIYFNSDGKEGSMCGNGGRCITAFAHQIRIIDKSASFLAMDGIHHSEIVLENGNECQVKLGMNDINEITQHENTFELNTGSPHYVEFTDDVNDINVFEKGRQIRYDQRFAPGGTNVNFVEIKSDKIIARTYERGVEDITLSCGTGVTASAIATAMKLGMESGPVNISTLGGDLRVYFKKSNASFHEIQLEGPTMRLFSGIFEI